MIIPIDLNSEHIPYFLDYLRANIKINREWHAECSYDNDGCLIEKSYFTLLMQKGNIPIVITVKWKADGSLKPITVEAEDPSSPAWEEEIQNIFRETLVATINKPTTKVFFRNIYAYLGQPLDGEYYVRGYRFAPAVYPDEPGLGSEERILYIDTYADGADDEQAYAIGKIKAERAASLLSVFLNIGLYQIPIEKRWVLTSLTESRRFHLGFRTPSPPPVSMPAKGHECAAGRTRLVDRAKLQEDPLEERRLFAPSDIRLLFRIVDELPSDEKETYWNATGLFRISLTAGRYIPSLQMAYQIAATDALINKRNHSQHLFKEFVCQYCPDISPNWAADIYGRIRSGHFHSGDFPGGEYKPFLIGPFMTQDFAATIHQQFLVHDVMRAVLIRWLLGHDKKAGT